MKYFVAKMNHIKPTFLEGGEVWHDIDKCPMLDHTILVELQVKGSDGLIYRTQDVCVDKSPAFHAGIQRFESFMQYIQNCPMV